MLVHRSLLAFRRKCKHFVLHFRRKSVPTASNRCFRFQHIGSSVNLILLRCPDSVLPFLSLYSGSPCVCAQFFGFFESLALALSLSPWALLSRVFPFCLALWHISTSSEANFCDLMNHLANILSCDATTTTLSYSDGRSFPMWDAPFFRSFKHTECDFTIT